MSVRTSSGRGTCPRALPPRSRHCPRGAAALLGMGSPGAENAGCASIFNCSAWSRASKNYRKLPLDVALHTRIPEPKLFCIPLLPPAPHPRKAPS